MFERGVLESSRLLHIVAALWMFFLAFVILVDVTGRTLFNSPLVGTAEIIANSVVAVTFLQLPFAIRTHGMLFTPVLRDRFPAALRKGFKLATYLTGVGLFAVLATSAAEPAMLAWESGEYFGEGALRVPTWPTKTIIVAMGYLAAAAYLLLALQEWQGRSTEQVEGVQY